jgi:adenylate cyclase
MTAIRRLAAILAADVVGYSRLIGADEGGTLARLKSIRRELIDPQISDHRGRIVKTTGDGILVEFASVVDALGCATEVQARMAERDAAETPDKRIEFRIGIHQGDIVVEDGDIFGDGVNIAARLEGLAEPGGICVSARVQEDAAGKLDLVEALLSTVPVPDPEEAKKRTILREAVRSPISPSSPTTTSSAICAKSKPPSSRKSRRTLFKANRKSEAAVYIFVVITDVSVSRLIQAYRARSQ